MKMTDNETTDENAATENAGEGDKPTQNELNQKTNAAAERLEKANEEAERINAENRARIAAGGITDAGGEKEKPKEETAKEYADKIMSGEIK